MHRCCASDHTTEKRDMKHVKPKMPLLAAAAVMTLSSTAHAYVGPGVALSTIVMGLGVLGALLLWVFVLVWYPVKRLWRRWRGNRRAAEDAEVPPPRGDGLPQ